MLLLTLFPALWILSRLHRSPLKLVYRTRWLLLILLFGYAYSLPGEPLWPVLGSASPSWEGLFRGASSAAHLMVLLLWLDVLVLSMSVNDLLTGLFQLLQPLAKLGLDPRTPALRLGLTVCAINDIELGSRNLAGLLKLDQPVAMPQQFSIHSMPMRWVDWVVPGLLLLTFIGSAAIVK
jgi:energy-coupling factor transporter transmembrane protein EcfT